jgi:hypothetical protein
LSRKQVGRNWGTPVQAFAWRVIETRCNYQAYELDQRSFWAYDTRVSSADGGVVYSISVVSDLTWKKTDPPTRDATRRQG